MGPFSNLLYYASVAKGTMILAEHSEVASDLGLVAVECLEKVPPLHSRFTYTTKRRMFNCLMEGAFTYCAIVDEALGKQKAYCFLEHVRDEFKLLLQARGLELDGSGLEAYSLADDFAAVYRHLVAPLVGFPEKKVNGMEEKLLAQRDGADDHHRSEHTSHRPSNLQPLREKGRKIDKKTVKDQVIEVKEIMMESNGKVLDKGQKLETLVAGGCTPDSGMHMQKGGNLRQKGQQLASGMWWRNVKVVLILDIVVCAILFAIWLGICRGFQCVKSKA